MNNIEIIKLRKQVAEQLQCKEEDLIWSDKCRNPYTNYHHKDGTIKGEQGFWVTKHIKVICDKI